VLFTVNDSGDGPLVYAVDKDTGRTRVATTYSSGDVTDVEAVAPGRHRALWVGDIGDNDAERDTVSVYRLPRMRRLPSTVHAARFDLAYPDGPVDAEALLVHPRTGRIYVVTKTFEGGTVYAAPAHLRRGSVNRLERVARVPGLVTDGTFLPDGRHVLLRTYGTASLYRFRDWKLLDTTQLPAERQGEGITVSRSGDVYVSSEGAFSKVLQVFLPGSMTRQITGPGSAATPSPSPSPDGGRHGATATPPVSTDEGNGVWIGGGVLMATFIAWLLFTTSRPRGRRTR
jgi:hypothetical protein